MERSLKVVSIIIFLVAANNQILSEIDSLKNYIGSLHTPAYIPVYIYIHKSLDDRLRDQPNLIKDTVKITQQSFAWYNIKIIIKKSYHCNDFELSDQNVTELYKIFKKTFDENPPRNGIYVLFLQRSKLYNGTDHDFSVINLECRQEAYYAIVDVRGNRSLNDYSTTLSRALGQVFSATPNNSTSDCRNESRKCIMIRNADAWPSNVSYPPYFSLSTAESITFFTGKCKFDTTYDKELNLEGYNTCGNGIVDIGEECDCGFPENCALKMQENCCNMTTCKLKPGAQCSYGECCDNCKLTRHVCRSAIGECDLEEICDGTSPYCPRDKHKVDGSECSKGYCAGGKCPNLDQQCAKNMGDGFYFSEICQKEQPNEPPCGMLACSHGQQRDDLVGESHPKCQIKLPNQSLPRKLAFIPNGYNCGDNKMCLNNECKSVANNVQHCSGVNCAPEMICNLGQCEQEYSIDTLCEGKLCGQDEVCDDYTGKCVPYIIPENQPIKYVAPTTELTKTTVAPQKERNPPIGGSSSTPRTDDPTGKNKKAVVKPSAGMNSLGRSLNYIIIAVCVIVISVIAAVSIYASWHYKTARRSVDRLEL